MASNIINRIQWKDGKSSHAAVEVFASDDTIVFGGEVKTTLKLNKKLLKEVLNESFRDCGYIDDRRKVFTKKEVRLVKDTKIINKIHAQSPDIAMATTDKKEDSGWNDQNISFGGYDSLTPTGQGVGKYLAQSFGDYLFNQSFLSPRIGSDIKIVFTIDVDDKDFYTPKSIEHLTVAIPNKGVADITEFVKDSYTEWVKETISNTGKDNKTISDLLSVKEPAFTVNGTGRYVNHGYAHDASLTGRKLAVNNMSVGPVFSQCQNGGGSLVKPFHASDLLLPILCNWIAYTVVSAGFTTYANVAVAATIGQTNIDSICITGDTKFNKNTKLVKDITDSISKWDLSPKSLATKLGFFDEKPFDFYQFEKNNFVLDYSKLPLLGELNV